MTHSFINTHAVYAIYKNEMARTWRNILQSIIAPVISTCLYFVVFGAATEFRISEVENINYGAFIVPGLVMLTLLTQSVLNSSFSIYFPKFVGTIYEILSAPISPFEVVLGYVGAAATKSVIIGFIILITSSFIVEIDIAHPFIALFFMIFISIIFAMLGFIIGVWAQNFEQLQVIPLLFITPLAFLGGSFYSINILPPFWQTLSLFNPVLYLISGFRWSFMEMAEVNVWLSVITAISFFCVFFACIWWIFKTGYRLKH